MRAHEQALAYRRELMHVLEGALEIDVEAGETATSGPAMPPTSPPARSPSSASPRLSVKLFIVGYSRPDTPSRDDLLRRGSATLNGRGSVATVERRHFWAIGA
jgi:hypothetical protein